MPENKSRDCCQELDWQRCPRPKCFVITYVISIGGFTHVVAGSVEAWLLMLRAETSAWGAVGGFILLHWSAILSEEQDCLLFSHTDKSGTRLSRSVDSNGSLSTRDQCSADTVQKRRFSSHADHRLDCRSAKANAHSQRWNRRRIQMFSYDAHFDADARGPAFDRERCLAEKRR